MLHSTCCSGRCNAAVVLPGAAGNGHDEMLAHSIHRSTVLINGLGSDKQKNKVPSASQKPPEGSTRRTKSKSTQNIPICVETVTSTHAAASSSRNRQLRSQVRDSTPTTCPTDDQMDSHQLSAFQHGRTNTIAKAARMKQKRCRREQLHHMQRLAIAEINLSNGRAPGYAITGVSKPTSKQTHDTEHADKFED